MFLIRLLSLPSCVFLFVFFRFVINYYFSRISCQLQLFVKKKKKKRKKEFKKYIYI